MLLNLPNGLLSIFVTNSTTPLLPVSVEHWKHFVVVKLPGNKLEGMCMFSMLRQILILDLSHNLLKKIQANCFPASNKLHVLYVNSNLLSHLEPDCFKYLIQMMFLNLSDNPLVNIPERSSTLCSNLKHIAIQTSITTLKNIAIDAFDESNVKIVLTQSYHICCIAPNSLVCTALKPWYISCSDILSSLRIKLFFVTVSVVVLLLNIVSIVLHNLSLRSSKPYDLIIIPLIFVMFCMDYTWELFGLLTLDTKVDF